MENSLEENSHAQHNVRCGGNGEKEGESREKREKEGGRKKEERREETRRDKTRREEAERIKRVRPRYF